MTAKLNAAFIGGGLPTAIALGGYSVVCDEFNFDSYSGDSIGALVAVSLSAGKSVVEIKELLEKNAMYYCIPYFGKAIIKRSVNRFLGNMKFKDLPVECYVSVAPLRSDFPRVITRENAEEMTVGKVVAASAAVPLLYLPSLLKINGRRSLVFDGGLVLNPPLKPNAKNVLFSYNNDSSMKPSVWNVKARWPQEEAADLLFNPYTYEFGLFGTAGDVRDAFAFGKKCMEEQKSSFFILE